MAAGTTSVHAKHSQETTFLPVCIKEEVIPGESETQVLDHTSPSNSSTAIKGCCTHAGQGYSILDLIKLNGASLFQLFVAVEKLTSSELIRYWCKISPTECTRYRCSSDKNEGRQLMIAHLLNHVESYKIKLKKDPSYESKLFFPYNHLNVTIKKEYEESEEFPSANFAVKKENNVEEDLVDIEGADSDATLPEFEPESSQAFSDTDSSIVEVSNTKELNSLPNDTPSHVADVTAKSRPDADSDMIEVSKDKVFASSSRDNLLTIADVAPQVRRNSECSATEMPNTTQSLSPPNNKPSSVTDFGSQTRTSFRLVIKKLQKEQLQKEEIRKNNSIDQPKVVLHSLTSNEGTKNASNLKSNSNCLKKKASKKKLSNSNTRSHHKLQSSDLFDSSSSESDSEESDHHRPEPSTRKKFLISRKHTLTSTLRNRHHVFSRQFISNKRSHQRKESGFTDCSSDDDLPKKKKRFPSKKPANVTFKIDDKGLLLVQDFETNNSCKIKLKQGSSIKHTEEKASNYDSVMEETSKSLCKTQPSSILPRSFEAQSSASDAPCSSADAQSSIPELPCSSMEDQACASSASVESTVTPPSSMGSPDKNLPSAPSSPHSTAETLLPAASSSCSAAEVQCLQTTETDPITTVATSSSAAAEISSSSKAHVPVSCSITETEKLLCPAKMSRYPRILMRPSSASKVNKEQTGSGEHQDNHIPDSILKDDSKNSKDKVESIAVVEEVNHSEIENINDSADICPLDVVELDRYDLPYLSNKKKTRRKQNLTENLKKDDNEIENVEKALLGVWNDHCYIRLNNQLDAPEAKAKSKEKDPPVIENHILLGVNKNYQNRAKWIDNSLKSKQVFQKFGSEWKEDESEADLDEPRFELVSNSSKKITAAADPTVKAKALRLISELRHRKPKEVMVCTVRVMKGSRSSYVVQDFYTCEICGKRFTAPNSLYGHYRGHAGIKPFRCDICGQTFTRAHSLSYHAMIHNNTSRFKCKFCDKKFRHPTHFKEHLNAHSGKEPYKCPDCHRRFRTRNTFRRHAMSKHNKVLTPIGYAVPSKVLQTITWDK